MIRKVLLSNVLQLYSYVLTSAAISENEGQSDIYTTALSCITTTGLEGHGHRREHLM